MVLFSRIHSWAYFNAYCYGVEMKNWGQIPRKIKVHKRYTLSPFVLNLTLEQKKWAELGKRLRKRMVR